MGRNTVELKGDVIVLPVAAKAVIEAGQMVMLNETGFALPAKKKENQTAAGRAEEYVDNSKGTDGEQTILIRRGIFKWENDTANAVTTAHLLKPCYMKDSETVTSLATGASIAGKVISIEHDGVAVEMI